MGTNDEKGFHYIPELLLDIVNESVQIKFKALFLLCCYLSIDVKIQTSLVNLLLDLFGLLDHIFSQMASTSSLPLTPLFSLSDFNYFCTYFSSISWLLRRSLFASYSYFLLLPHFSLFLPSSLSFIAFSFEELASVMQLAGAKTFSESTFAPPVLYPRSLWVFTLQCLCFRVKQQGVPPH